MNACHSPVHPDVRPSFTELLHVAGHRPAKFGHKWICANCPPGKCPAMSVGDGVFFCHRCQIGGNLITLLRELGCYHRRRFSKQQRRRYTVEMGIATKIHTQFDQWLRDQTRLHRQWFRDELDSQAWITKQYQKTKLAGQSVPDGLLNLAFEVQAELERLGTTLDYLDFTAKKEVFQAWLHSKKLAFAKAS
jgi:hypothetical protein